MADGPENAVAESVGQRGKYPLAVRIFGVIAVVGGGIQIVGIVLAALVLAAILRSGIDLSGMEATGHLSMTTLVIAVVLIIISIAQDILFFVLGVRLLRNNHRRAATIASTMIALESLELICRFMVSGMGSHLITPFVNMFILFALEVYADPTLRGERQLQMRLRELEDKAAAEDGTLGRDATGKGYITLNFFNVFWVFVICCFLGLILEVIWHMVVVEPGVYEDRAGLLYGPFSPIYGFGAVLMTVALNRYYNKNPLVIFLVAGAIGAAFEFFVSWFMETAFGIVAWDYTGTFLNIQGRTNFMFFCMWGALGLVWVRYLLPLMLQAINTIPWNWRYSVTSLCAVFMLVDGVLTLSAFDCWYQRADGSMNYENAPAIIEFCNEEYPDEYMENRFQSMTMTTEMSSRA